MVYVVERYLPGLDACQLLNGLRRFEASSPLAVVDANHRAALRFGRIVSAVTVTRTKGEPR